MAERVEDRGQDSWDPKRTTLDAADSQAAAAGPSWSETTLDEPAAMSDDGRATTLDKGPSPATTTLDGAPSCTATTLDAQPTEQGFVGHRLPSGMAADYELLERLGGGAEAVVYRARDKRHDRDVALKIYLSVVPTYRFEVGDEDHAKHFPHEHCVDIYERREENGTHIEVMEFCAGGTLADYARGRKLDRDELELVVAEVAEAIHALASWRHGDIKPQNILVRATQPLDLVLTDFGITEDMGERSRKTSLGHGTRLYQPAGADEYMRKEDDWWALGIIVVELATGQHPLDGLLRVSHSEKAVRDFLIHNSVPIADVSDARVRHLARGLLARRPEDRFGYEQVWQWLAGEDPALPEESSSYQPPVEPIAFQGTHYTDPAALAEAIRSSKRSFEAGRGITLDNLVEWSTAHPNYPRMRVLSQKRDALPGDAVAGLLAALLADDGRLVISGLDFTTAEGLVGLGADIEKLDQFHRWHVLERCSEVLFSADGGSSGADSAGFARLDYAWRSCFDEAQELLPKGVRWESKEVREALLRESWMMAIDQNRVAEVRKLLQRELDANRFLDEVHWFAWLWRKREEPSAVAALKAALPVAQESAGELLTEWAAQQEQERAEAEMRRVEEERERRQARARLWAERRRRARRMIVRLLVVAFYALSPALFLLIWEVVPRSDMYLKGPSNALLDFAWQVMHYQLWPVVLTMVLCAPGAWRERFSPAPVFFLHTLAVTWPITSLALHGPPPSGIWAYPWVGCALVGIHQALFRFTPLDRIDPERNFDWRVGGLALIQLGSTFLYLVALGGHYLGWAGLGAWYSFTSLVGFQIFFGSVIAFFPLILKQFQLRYLLLLNVLPIVIYWTAPYQRRWLTDILRWEKRDCVASTGYRCDIYQIGGPIPEPQQWVLWALGAYVALCVLAWLISRARRARENYLNVV